MKQLKRILVTSLASVVMALSSHATIILDDTFADGTRTNMNLPTQSPWAVNSSNTNTTIWAYPNLMVLSNYSGNNRVFWTYFTSNSPAFEPLTNGYPVQVATNQQIRVLFKFVPINVVAVGPQSLRFGLLSYESNTVGRVFGDTNYISSSGLGVTGYRADIYMMQTFTNDSPLGLRVRTNIFGDPDPLGKAATWFSLGSGPGAGSGLSNAPAFQSGSNYVFDLLVQVYDGSNIVTGAFYGSGLAVTNVQVDTTGLCPNSFDCLMIRDNRSTETCDLINVSEVKVEVTAIGGPVVTTPFPITSAQFLTSDSLKITWTSLDGASYQVLSASALTGPWTTNATVIGTGTSTSYTNSGNAGVTSKFFRVISP
ncbi:MAG: hypothetical protein U1F98_01945 [Verrucomicrobiota bacterium]